MMRQPTNPRPATSLSHAVRMTILASGIVASWTILGLAGYVVFKLSPMALY